MRAYSSAAFHTLSRRYFAGTNPQWAKNRPLPAGSSSPLEDDFYALLLSDPTPNPAQKTIKSINATEDGDRPFTTTPPKPQSNQISFSTPLAGPSARMRGLSRGEKGLGRPTEPDNCCMSGCVNCVWDAYREEVEEWSAARKRRDSEFVGKGTVSHRHDAARQSATDQNEGAIGDSDEAGSLDGYQDVDLDQEGSLFEGVPIGIREFMRQEKKIKERKERRQSSVAT